MDYQARAKLADKLWNRATDRAFELGYGDEAFADWTGATGMHLPFDKWVKNKAIYINKISVVDNQQ